MIRIRVSFPAVLAVAASAMVALAAAQPDEPININTATVEELTELPRIGEVTAARIVAWREENGPFASTDELLNVQGIGERVYERIKPHVTIGEPPARGPGGPGGREVRAFWESVVPTNPPPPVSGPSVVRPA